MPVCPVSAPSRRGRPALRVIARFCLVGAIAWTTRLSAQVITGTEDDWKSTAGTAWGTASNWSLGSVPGSSNTAVFTSSSAASGTITLSGSSVVGIVWLSGASSYTLTDTSGPQITLTLGVDGLQNYSSNSQTIAGSRTNVTLGTSTFFDVGRSGNLTISATGTNGPFNLVANTPQ